VLNFVILFFTQKKQAEQVIKTAYYYKFTSSFVEVFPLKIKDLKQVLFYKMDGLFFSNIFLAYSKLKTHLL